MTGFLCSQRLMDRVGDQIMAAAVEAGIDLNPIFVPADPEARLSPEALEAVDISFFSGDLFPDLGRSYFAASQGSPNVKWIHLMNAGIDAPIFSRFIERGVKLTTSSGSTAEPIAQTLIGGLLMLARPFLAWGESQRRKEWAPLRMNPVDLSTQTMVVYGLGAIGKEIARLGQALGLHVIGIRRSPLREGDPVDEMATPAALHQILPRCDWLAIACPLTDETRHVINAEAIGLLPKGAHILNIARGEVIEQEAMIAALRSGQLGGAYLDVATPEPLPADSLLWDLPNVIITPHNSAMAQGNEGRQVDIFCENLKRWARGETMLNEAN